MSALRKAGVWLGLVEEDDRHDDAVFDDEFADDEDDFAPVRPRSLARSTPRAADRRPTPEPRPSRDHASRDHASRDHASRDHEAHRPEPRSGSRADAEPRASWREAPSRFDAADHARAGSGRRDDRDDTRRDDTGHRDEHRDSADTTAYARESARLDAARDRASVRQLARTSSPPTQDNLALAPQVQLRERAVVSSDAPRRHQITTLHPTGYSEARTIGEHFRDGYPVIMNLTDLDEPDAKRLVDFAAGLAFGLRGSMERVTNRVFLLSPPNIQVSAEDKARIAEGGFLEH